MGKGVVIPLIYPQPVPGESDQLCLDYFTNFQFTSRSLYVKFCKTKGIMNCEVSALKPIHSAFCVYNPEYTDPIDKPREGLHSCK